MNHPVDHRRSVDAGLNCNDQSRSSPPKGVKSASLWLPVESPVTDKRVHHLQLVSDEGQQLVEQGLDSPCGR